jgi:hypothetical protein
MPPRLTFLINCFDNSTLFVKCSAVRIRGTHLAHTRFIFKSRTLTHDKSSHGLWPGEPKKGTFAEKVTQRAVIKFCVDIGKTPTDTHKFLKQSDKNSKVSRSLIFKWNKRFADGRDSTNFRRL